MKKCIPLLLSAIMLMVPVQSFAAPTDGQMQKKQHHVYEDSNETGKPNFQILLKDKQNKSPFTLPNIEAKAYFLMDAFTGLVIAKSNEHERRQPASMTKMMTAFVVLDQLKQKKISWDDVVVVSDRAANKVGYADLLQANEKITVRELMYALLLPSANDAAVALAEYVAGTEAAFIEMMNKKAKQLGLKNTHFITSNGLSHDPDDYIDPPKVPGEQYMSAHDSAMLTKKLMRAYPVILDITATPEYTIHKGTNNEKVIKNTNNMLPGLKYEYKGVQGVKTGSTRAAGYCFAGTVKRTGVRLISVVMGAESDDKRFSETAKLYDHVYKFFKPITLLHAGESIPALKNVVVADAATNNVPIGLKEDLNVVAKNGDQQKFTYQPHLKSNLKAPLKKGEEVGTVDVLYNGKKVEGLEPMKLVVKQDVERINPFEKLLKKMAAAM